MVPHAAEILAIAWSTHTLRESPPGSNDGPELEAFLKVTRFSPGDKWCMFYALACVIKGFEGQDHVPVWLSRSGSCQLSADLAERFSKLSADAAIGSICLLRNSNGHFYHAGLVRRVDEAAGTVGTIEGNSNSDGSANGIGVFQHTRRIADCRFIIW